ncbi:MAG: hypothetical protein E7562_06570 [Ruminococcaceae bacterium]|nr:hypothetical protein [Oscillospiraceae bacterium]
MNYFDLHCDTPYVCYKNQISFYDNKTAVSAESAKHFDVWKQCFAVWIKDDMQNPFAYYKKVLNSFKQSLSTSPKNLIPFFTVEGGAVIEDDISRLSQLKADGISALTLTWNGKNNIACGCKEKGGITSFGKLVIKEMNRLKIICDISHLNEQSFWDVIKISNNIIATHSNCKALFNHPRNLSDEQLMAISEKNGVIGLCCYPEFLGMDVFEGIYANIVHLLNLGLEDNIAFGSDFDGAEMDKKLDSAEKIPDLMAFLLQKGLKEELLDKIFYNNSEKIFVCL